MADDTHLAAENTVVADLDTAGDADLGNQKAVRANVGIVADGNQVAHFCTVTDDGIAESAAVDGTVGADFDIVFDENAANLGDFVMNAAVGGIAETILADYGAGMDNDAIANSATVVNCYVRINYAISTDFGGRADGAVGIDAGIIADLSLGRDNDKIVDIDIFPDLSGRIDAGPFAKADGFVFAMAVDQHYDLHKSIIRVVTADQGVLRVGYIFADHDSRSGALAHLLFVFGVGQKADIAGIRFIEGGSTGNNDVFIAKNSTIDVLG